MRPVTGPHTDLCASDDCPCFAEGKRSIRTELAEIRDELVDAMKRVSDLLDPEDGDHE